MQFLDNRIRLETHYPGEYPTGKPDSDHLCNRPCLSLFEVLKNKLGDQIGIMKNKTKNERTQNMVAKTYR